MGFKNLTVEDLSGYQNSRKLSGDLEVWVLFPFLILFSPVMVSSSDTYQMQFPTFWTRPVLVLCVACWLLYCVMLRIVLIFVIFDTIQTVKIE